MSKSAEINLPYFKQGDDLHGCLDSCDSNVEALELHAQMLEDSAKILRDVADIVRKSVVQFDADTHMIIVSGDDNVIDSLVNAGLAQEFLDEEEEEC